MKRALVLATSAALMTGGYAALQHHADGVAQAAVARFESRLPAGSDLIYAKATADLFTGGARLQDVTFTLAEGHVLSADSIDVGEVSARGETQEIDRLVAQGVKLVPADFPFPVTILVGRIEVRELSSDPLRAMLDGGAADWPEFAGADFEGIALADADGILATAERGRIAGGAFGRLGRTTIDEIVIPLGINPEHPEALQEIRADGLEMSGFDFGPTLLLPDEPTPAQVRQAVAETPDSTAIVRNITGTRDGATLLRIDAIAAETDNNADGVSHQQVRMGSILLAGEVFERDGENLLRDVGYDELRGEMLMKMVYDAPNGILDIASLKLDLADAASLDFGMRIGSVPLRFMTPGYDPGETDIAQLTFDGMALTLIDDSLLHRIATVIGGQQGIDGDIYLQAQAASLRQTAASTESAQLRELFEELANFVEDPGTLEMKATPAQPIPVLAMAATIDANPMLALALLEFEVVSR